MSNKRCIAVAELAVHLSNISGVTNAWKVADVASKLTTLEIRAQRFAERNCNESMTDEQWNRGQSSLERRAREQLDRLFAVTAEQRAVPGFIERRRPGVQLGGDPRGCCLRLIHPDLPRNGMGDGYAVGA